MPSLEPCAILREVLCDSFEWSKKLPADLIGEWDEMIFSSFWNYKQLCRLSASTVKEARFRKEGKIISFRAHAQN
jgi:hypothetical protein